MKYTTILAVIVLAALGASLARADEPSFSQLLDECLPGMSAAAIPDRQASEQRLQNACYQVSRPGQESQRAAACTLMASKLGSATAQPARVWLAKQLEFIGREECVAALTTLLKDDDAELRDLACRALTHNPAAQANASLVAALEKAQDEAWKVTLLNALGARRDQASVAALATPLGSSQTSVAQAAALALGKIGTPEALKLLQAARPGAAGALRVSVGEAMLCCAERLLADGKKTEAVALYETLAYAKESRPVRLGALQGRLRASGPTVAMVLDLLGDADADARAIAAGAIAQLPADANATLLAGYAKLPTAGKVLLLAGLARRGETKAAALAQEAVQGDVPELKQAGLSALAKVGDSTCVPQLIALMEAGGPLGTIASDSLNMMAGNGVDERLVTLYPRGQSQAARTAHRSVRESRLGLCRAAVDPAGG